MTVFKIKKFASALKEKGNSLASCFSLERILDLWNAAEMDWICYFKGYFASLNNSYRHCHSFQTERDGNAYKRNDEGLIAIGLVYIGL